MAFLRAKPTIPAVADLKPDLSETSGELDAFLKSREISYFRDGHLSVGTFKQQETKERSQIQLLVDAYKDDPKKRTFLLNLVLSNDKYKVLFSTEQLASLGYDPRAACVRR